LLALSTLLSLCLRCLLALSTLLSLYLLPHIIFNLRLSFSFVALSFFTLSSLIKLSRTSSPLLMLSNHLRPQPEDNQGIPSRWPTAYPRTRLWHRAAWSIARGAASTKREREW
jgi:hypothetical protein